MRRPSFTCPLFEHLQHCNQAVVTLTFAEIETLMGCSLPESARKKKNWWSNRDSPSALQAIARVTALTLVRSAHKGLRNAQKPGKPDRPRSPASSSVGPLPGHR
ncbi:DUF7662 domain-containing protein [Trichothermofontia sp.]